MIDRRNKSTAIPWVCGLLLVVSLSCSSGQVPDKDGRSVSRRTAQIDSRQCAEGTRCKIMGLCFADRRKGRCVAKKQADCTRSYICARFGRCSLHKSGYCVVSSDGDCRRSRACTEHQECKAESFQCVRKDPDWSRQSLLVWRKVCTRHGFCKILGLCQYRGGRCRARSDQDCRSSQVCKLYGHCRENDGQCVASTDEDCRHSSMCSIRGFCSAVGRICADRRVLLSAGGERQVHWLKAGIWGELCGRRKLCLYHGTCSPGEHHCVARGDEDCTTVCRASGRCAAINGVCVARTDPDCWGSWNCAFLDECRARGGECKKE